ncbi:aquaporin NIP1-1-like isoform X1 [Triticum dicoccoides]|uniref:aquaporin NIP1-1-like isoform X1 n=1 Tax=Triticum dicoccoides TaxID=85692 RepID=UPI000E786B4F|nr:aquaporin NIP1-1-like isoform X1 [Triticum dicoccoides]
MDLDKTNTVGSDGAANGQDLEQARRGQELPPPAGHATKGLAVGHLIRELVLEGVATFLVVFWSCVAALMQEMHHSLTFPTVCLVVALTVAFVLGWMGPAHLNPAVTFTFAAFRYFPWRKLPLYVATQIAASVLACLSVNAIMSPHDDNFYGTVPRPPGAGARLPFLLELLASAVLMIVISTVAMSNAVTHAKIYFTYMQPRGRRNFGPETNDRSLPLLILGLHAEQGGGRDRHRGGGRDAGAGHRARVGRLDEPGEEPGPGDRLRPLHLHLDLRHCARRRHAARRALQQGRPAVRHDRGLPLRRQGRVQQGGRRRSLRHRNAWNELAS